MKCGWISTTPKHKKFLQEGRIAWILKRKNATDSSSHESQSPKKQFQESLDVFLQCVWILKKKIGENIVIGQRKRNVQLESVGFVLNPKKHSKIRHILKFYVISLHKDLASQSTTQ
jgi:hypothetical protein